MEGFKNFKIILIFNKKNMIIKNLNIKKIIYNKAIEVKIQIINKVKEFMIHIIYNKVIEVIVQIIRCNKVIEIKVQVNKLGNIK